METVIDLLEARRIKSGQNHTKFAKVTLDISRQEWWSLRRGKRGIGEETRGKILEAFSEYRHLPASYFWIKGVTK